MKYRLGFFIKFWALVGILSITAVAFVPSSLQIPDPLPDLVERLLPSVVNISSTTLIQTAPPGWDMYFKYYGIPTQKKQSSLGSGFIVDKNGLIYTNNHVVAHATEVMVTLHDNRQFRAKIIGKDPKMDLALLRIRDDKGKTPERLIPATLGDTEKVRIAETVIAIGNPFGLKHTVTRGIISAKNRTIGLGLYDNLLQTDASINPGNSGGPLFNLKGEVIGINTVIFSKTGQSGGVGFAIPSNEAKRIIGDLEKLGRVPRAWLGIVGIKNTVALQQYFQLSTAKGIIIENLVKNGPTDKVGIDVGDVLLKLDGTDASDLHSIEKFLNQKRVGQSVTLTIQRGKKVFEKTLTLPEMPPQAQEFEENEIM